MGKGAANLEEEEEQEQEQDSSDDESDFEEVETPPAKKVKTEEEAAADIDWKPVVASTLQVGDEVQLPVKMWRLLDERCAEPNANPSEVTGGELCADDCPFEEDELQNATVVFIHKEGEYKGDIELLPFYCFNPLPGVGMMETIKRFYKLYDGEAIGPEWNNVVNRLVMLNGDSKDDKKYFKQMSKCEPYVAPKVDAKEEMWM